MDFRFRGNVTQTFSMNRELFHELKKKKFKKHSRITFWITKIDNRIMDFVGGSNTCPFPIESLTNGMQKLTKSELLYS